MYSVLWLPYLTSNIITSSNIRLKEKFLQTRLFCNHTVNISFSSRSLLLRMLLYILLIFVLIDNPNSSDFGPTTNDYLTPYAVQLIMLCLGESAQGTLFGEIVKGGRQKRKEKKWIAAFG